MGLVDYSSEEEDDDKAVERDSLPPLPRAFHDLYAATVRTAPADDPSLHQGRHRAIPHVAGQWPSHLYIEWFPLVSEHARLNSLLESLHSALSVDSTALVHSFLTSDLGAPLPLHISLSRPFVLATGEKAGFLVQLVDAVSASGVSRFDVSFAGLDWYRGPDSARAFLVLRAVVANVNGGDDTTNRPLVTLLDRCNERVTAVGQPALYAGRGPGDDSDTDSPSYASAFHVSVAWTLAADVNTWADATQKAYEEWRQETRDNPPLRIPVDSIKAKIGNVVTDIPLRKPFISAASTAAISGRRQSKRTRSGDGSVSADDGEQPSSKKSMFGL